MSRGARGYSPQPPDLTSRLYGPPGHPAPRGAAPYRYYNPTGRRRIVRGVTRGEAPARTPTAPIDGAVKTMALAIAQVLNDMVGINVRQPSSHAPPFRARQWDDSRNFTIALAGATFPIHFFPGGASTPANTVVPPGVRGVLFNLEVYAALGVAAAATAQPFLNAKYSLLKNNQVVSGFDTLACASFTVDQITDAAGADLRGAGQVTPSKVLVPVQLVEGDTLSLFSTGSGATAYNGLLRASGWFYPVELQGDNIVGTMADRGNLDGLARRL